MKQKSYLFVGIFATLSALSGRVFADTSHNDAKGTGNAKTALESGITVENKTDINFGTIMRFGKNPSGTITCAFRTGAYNCVSSDSDKLKIMKHGSYGVAYIYRSEGNTIQSITSSDAILSNGNGNIITAETEVGSIAGMPGYLVKSINGTLTLNGDEPDGEYSTEYDGGEPYTVTVNY